MVDKNRATKTTLSAWLEGNPLKRWRLAQPPEGWNRSVLARKLGVSHTAVASWEDGKRLPVINAFAKIEALTGISCAQWMRWFSRGQKHKQAKARSQRN
jgi:ribosome-binding protein aMBF1 (putative translation factor)